MELDDQQAILILKAGNLEGLEHLVRNYQHGAVRVSAFITSDLATAEDIVQAAFIKLVDKIYQFNDRQKFKPWFYKIVVNDSIRFSNRSSRFISYDDTLVRQKLSFLTDPTPLPEAFAISEQTKRAVWAALGELPVKERSAIVLQYFEGFSEKDIAEALNRPMGTIKWQLHSARKHLEEILTPILDCRLFEEPLAEEVRVANVTGEHHDK